MNVRNLFDDQIQCPVGVEEMLKRFCEIVTDEYDKNDEVDCAESPDGITTEILLEDGGGITTSTNETEISFVDEYMKKRLFDMLLLLFEAAEMNLLF